MLAGVLSKYSRRDKVGRETRDKADDYRFMTRLRGSKRSCIDHGRSLVHYYGRQRGVWKVWTGKEVRMAHRMKEAGRLLGGFSVKLSDDNAIMSKARINCYKSS